VNAVRFDQDGGMHGDNFDGTGFVAGLQQQGHDPSGMTVLIVGAGGAARAIALALRDARTKKVMISNRTVEKAVAIASALAMAGDTAPVEAVQAHDGSKVDLIVNTTSLGMHDGDALPLPLDAVDDGTLIADIIMSPAETTWMKSATKRGLAVHPGRHMLDCQIGLIGSFTGAL
jgi:shikimate dehydrogenase